MSSIRLHTSCALVTGVQTFALPILSVTFSISMATPSSLALVSIRLAVATQLRQPDPRTLICFMALPPLSDQGIEQIADADEGDGQIETEPRQAQIGRAHV